MFCGNCGTKIEGGYKFCPKCGTKVPNVVKIGITPKNTSADAASTKAESKNAAPTLNINNLTEKAKKESISSLLRSLINTKQDDATSVELYNEYPKDYLSLEMFVESDITEKSGIVSDMVSITKKPILETTNSDLLLSKYDKSEGKDKVIYHIIYKEHPLCEKLMKMIQKYNKDARNARFACIETAYREPDAYKIYGRFRRDGHALTGFSKFLFGAKSYEDMRNEFVEICNLVKKICEG